VVGTRLQSGKGRIPEDLTAVSRDRANQTCGKKYSGKSFQELLLDFFLLEYSYVIHFAFLCTGL